MIGRIRSSVSRIGVLGLEPFLEAKLASLEPDASLVTLHASGLDQLADAGLDVVVASADDPAVEDALRNDADVPVIVVTHRDEDVAEGLIGLARPVTSPGLRTALDQALGVPTIRRTMRSLMVEQDDHDIVERYAFGMRLVATLFTLGWIVLNLSFMPLWTVVAIATYAIVRSLWWRLSIPALAFDLAVVIPVAFVGVEATMATPAVSVVLPVLVWTQAGYQLGLWRGLGVMAGVVTATGVAGALVWGAESSAVTLALSPLALAALAEVTGAMIRRVVQSDQPGRRRDLEHFREALYDLSERQAVVALSFDVGTTADEVLARVLRETGATAAAILVAESNLALKVAAAHNLTKPPPILLTWSSGQQSSHAMGTSVQSATANAHSSGATAPTQGHHPPLVGSHTDRVAEVAARLAPCLPEGAVLTLPAVLDDELLGGILLVDPADELTADNLQGVATEAALAFDSVRLFNRLRAFTLDQERARVGRSLHDGVMQTLSHVGMQLDLAVHDDQVVADAATIRVLREHVLATIAELRAVVNDLRSVRLERGLPAALETMAATVSPAGGPSISVHSEPIAALDSQVEEQFLRIAQEAVSNAVRHARASSIEINLHKVGERLILQIKDDGVGFRTSKDTAGHDGGGVGMTSIRQRAAAINADLDIDLGPGASITVTHESRRIVDSVEAPSP